MNINKAAYEKMPIAEWTAFAQEDSWRLHYHLMPPTGWLNDPNGLCQFQGTYHVYYQYSPDDVDGKTKLWGHYTSRDMLHWCCHEPVLYEDSSYDERGVYSGSAFIENDRIHYVYTGNVKLEGNYDYINEGRLQNTIHVESRDGFVFGDKELLMSNVDYPDDISCHVRDPKILKVKDVYYMVLGARDRSSKGCVLVFKSNDLHDWEYTFRIQKEDFGYMWECPDLFELDGQYFLLVCPQGLPHEGIQYENIYQSGYFPIAIDFEKGTYELKAFQLLDYGFDFYAPQSFLDEQGRRILIGWMGLPDIEYQNPTSKRGWQHALAMPRELHVKDGYLYQTPLSEMKELRKGCAVSKDMPIYDACFEMEFKIVKPVSFVLSLREDLMISYDCHTAICTLSMGKSGYGRECRHVQVKELKNIHLYSDTSALEFYINDGEAVMTTRIYDDLIFHFACSLAEKDYEVAIWQMGSYTIQGE